MVFVKVRETYDLHTTKNKMTVISIHTPLPGIIKKNFPGLLMQCKAYRPYSCDVRVACASVLPLDPQGVGTSSGDVAPEDIFNPILYKAMSNLGMSQLEARINYLNRYANVGADIVGDTAAVDVDTVIPDMADDFNAYYGLLSNAHGWRHANPQAGLEMSKLRPLVYEILYNVGDKEPNELTNQFAAPDSVDGSRANVGVGSIRGNGKPMPFINCTSYSWSKGTDPAPDTGWAQAGFPDIYNAEVDVPYCNVVVGAIIVPPSRLHEFFYRMVIEWTIEFTAVRPVSEIMNFGALSSLGSSTHYQNYSYAKVKEAVTGDSETMLDSDQSMVSANVEVKKVM